MPSCFIPLEVQPGVGLEVGSSYQYDDWGSDGHGGLGEVFHVRDGALTSALPQTDVCLKRLKANFAIGSVGDLLAQAPAGSRRARLLDAMRTEYDEYVRMGGAHGHAPRAYALGAVVRDDDPSAATTTQSMSSAYWAVVAAPGPSSLITAPRA